MPAQVNIYNALIKKIKEIHPEIATQNKVIAFNIWSLENRESREINLSFDRAFKIYEFAKLKGGSGGFIAVAVSLEKLGASQNIALLKDGNIKIISLSADEIQELNATQLSNAVFDDKGNRIYQNLRSNEVVESINKLITR